MSAIEVTIVGAAVVSLAFAGLSTKSTIEAYNSPVRIEGTAVYSHDVSPGDTVIIPWVLRKTTDCPGSAARVWRGASGFYLSERTRPSALPSSDDFETFHIQTQVPELAPAGALTLEIIGEYQCRDETARRFTLGPVSVMVVE